MDSSSESLTKTPVSEWQIVFRMLRRSRGAMLGLVLTIALVTTTIMASLIAPYDPNEIVIDEALMGPSVRHIMGTDNFGRDVLSRVLVGSHLSLQLGLISVAIATCIGIVVGLVAGYYGGFVDSLLMWVMNVMLAFPSILLAMVVLTVLGPGLRNAMIAVGFSWIPVFARLIRGCVLSAREELYVLAARMVGAKSMSVMFRHILPNVTAPVIAAATFAIPLAILTGATLGFIGLGAKPPTPEWGTMLSEGAPYARRAWWMAVFPGIAIMASVLALNFLGDGLRDALDPRLRQ